MSGDPQTSNAVLLVRPAELRLPCRGGGSRTPSPMRPADADVAGRGAAQSSKASRAPEPGAGQHADPRRLARAREARRDLPEQLGVVPRRRDDRPLSDGHRGPPARAQCRRHQGAAQASSGFEVRRVVDLSSHERHEPFPRRHRKPDPRPPPAPGLRQPQPAHRPRRIADFDDQLDYSTLVFDAARPRRAGRSTTPTCC